MNVLLIWVEIGGETKLYKLLDVSDSDLSVLKSANGKYINSDEDIDGVQRVSDFISSENDYCENPDDAENCKWKDCMIATSDISQDVNIDFRIDQVFMCGFVV